MPDKISFVTAFVLILADLVKLVAMPAVAAVLVVVDIENINAEEISDVWGIDAPK